VEFCEALCKFSALQSIWTASTQVKNWFKELMTSLKTVRGMENLLVSVAQIPPSEIHLKKQKKIESLKKARDVRVQNVANQRVKFCGLRLLRNLAAIKPSVRKAPVQRVQSQQRVPAQVPQFPLKYSTMHLILTDLVFLFASYTSKTHFTTYTHLLCATFLKS
jgi:hypothetical protein